MSLVHGLLHSQHKEEFPMKILCVIVMVLGFSLVGAAQDATPSPTPTTTKPKAMSRRQVERELIKMENEMWEAWKDKDVKVFKARVPSDGVLVSDQGIETKEQMLKDIPSMGCDVKSFKLSDFKLIAVGGNTYVLAYKGTEEGTCGSTPLPPNLWATSVWVRRGGRWMAVSHQESASNK
jgi:ketosteroid isomerase-like protein